MIHWIESQPTLVIAVVVFGVCYAMAAALFGIATALSRRQLGSQLNTISPVTLAPLGAILGLLLAFLAARVWSNVAMANEYIGQEAAALSKTLLLSNALPKEVHDRIVAAITEHVNFIITRDWPAMENAKANPKTEPVGLTKAVAAIFSFTPNGADQQLGQQRALGAVEQAFEARRNRLRLSEAEIETVQWAVVCVLAILILMTTAMVHIGRPAALSMSLVMFSTAIAGCLVLLLANDRPFAAGGITISPAAFREIALD